MKKLIGLIFLLASSNLFCQVIDGAERVVDDFFNKGNVVKIYYNIDNIVYIPKSTISKIRIDEDDILIVNLEGEEPSDDSFDSKKWYFTLDDNHNLVIAKKKK